MNIGHYGVGLALKKADKSISLGLLFVAAQFVDILWAVFVLLGVERVEIVPGITASNPLDFVYYPFSHSLVASLFWAGLVYVFFRLLPARSGSSKGKAALVMGSAVLSHFFLDLIIHRPDLPLAPGDAPRIGLGLWNYVLASYVIEGLIFLGGFWLYMRATSGTSFAGRYGMLMFAAVLFLTNLLNLTGAAPPDTQTLAASGLAYHLLFIGKAFWLDRKRSTPEHNRHLKGYRVTRGSILPPSEMTQHAIYRRVCDAPLVIALSLDAEGNMSKFQQFVSRYQMIVFFVLTYLISWSIIVPFDGGIMPQGPMFAAFIVLAIVAGRRGTSDLWRQMTRWRVAWHWYLIAPGIVIVFHLSALAVNLLLGASIVSTSHLQPVSYLSGTVVPLLLLMGGEWEEPGWTGYALPRFQERFSRSPLLASLAVGVFRMIWHTPLLIFGAIPWYDFVFYSFAIQLIITWLYNRTGGNVLIAMLFHLASNILPATMIPLFGEADQELYRMLFVAFACVITLGILFATKARLGREGRPTGPVVSEIVDSIAYGGGQT